jgi:hypothetical protein
MLNGRERFIPISATDQVPEPSAHFPLPLCPASVLNLLAAYARLPQSLKESTAYGLSAANTHITRNAIETASDESGTQFADRATRGLGETGATPTRSSPPTDGQHLLRSRRGRRGRGGKR